MSECSEKREGEAFAGVGGPRGALWGTAEPGLERPEALGRLSQRQVWCACRTHTADCTHVSGHTDPLTEPASQGRDHCTDVRVKEVEGVGVREEDSKGRTRVPSWSVGLCSSWSPLPVWPVPTPRCISQRPLGCRQLGLTDALFIWLSRPALHQVWGSPSVRADG